MNDNEYFDMQVVRLKNLIRAREKGMITRSELAEEIASMVELFDTLELA